MTLTIPVYVERIASEKQPRYWAAALFIEEFDRTNAREDRALAQLESDLRRAVNKTAGSMRHDNIAFWSFCPPLTTHKLRLRLTLRNHDFTGEFFFAAWESLGRRLVICPRLPNLVFEWPRDASLDARASEVLLEYFRTREREGDERNSRPGDFAAGPGARITFLRIESHGEQRFQEERDRNLAHLAADEKMSGAEELERVGRCLNRRFPGDLGRASLREAETGTLLDLFADRKAPPAPVVLVGPPQVGKTTVIHEFLHRRLADESAPPAPELWLLSPQRVISGMSFVGQWEERFLSILRHVTDQRHLIYFDDPIGLFQAGRSRDSDLSIGHLLKVHLEDHPLGVLAEATPEQWGRLQEIDRGFADLFHRIPIREPSDTETLRILVRFLQDTEARTGCAFAPETLPLVTALQRRFVRTRAFPGKAAEMIRHLAATRPGLSVEADHVYRHFAARTGINPVFLDAGRTLDPDAVRTFFTDRIVGQEEAVDAVVASVVMSKARLNDPRRPVASLLFLGPTGVGKTECAKALSEFYFGSPDKLLRFDMNEFVGPESVMRLIGSFGRPAGLLTGAVRRNPYTVILLDEIEKASPDVFDLLLQVLGDGRLTDANGQTADFCNTIIILTSNLGSRTARQQVGFASDPDLAARRYVDAAEAFFRPELFNRIDRVIAFHELDRAQTTRLARRFVTEALDRFGLRDRHLAIEVDPAVITRLATAGFAPEAGARKLRRTVESSLVDALATRLAEPDVESADGLAITAGSDGGIVVATRRIGQADRIAPAPDPAPLAAEAVGTRIALLRTRLAAADEVLEKHWEPDLPGDSEARVFFFLLRDEVRHLRELLGRLEDTAGAPAAIRGPGAPRKPEVHWLDPADLEGLWDRLRHSGDRASLIASLMEPGRRPDPRTASLESLGQRINRLAFHAALGPRDLQHAILRFGGSARPPLALVASIIEAIEWHRDPHDRTPPEEALDGTRAVEGFALRESLALARGIHAVLAASGPPELVTLPGPDPDPEAGHSADREPGLAVRVAHVTTGACIDFASGQLVATPFPSLSWTLLPLYPEAPASPAAHSER